MNQLQKKKMEESIPLWILEQIILEQKVLNSTTRNPSPMIESKQITNGVVNITLRFNRLVGGRYRKYNNICGNLYVYYEHNTLDNNINNKALYIYVYVYILKLILRLSYVAQY